MVGRIPCWVPYFALAAATRHSEYSRATTSLNAWALTGNCAASNNYTNKPECGAVAAVITGWGQETLTLEVTAGGSVPTGGGVLPNGSSTFGPHTLFEIASNTKVMTAVALQRLVAHGNMSMNDTLNSVISASLGPSHAIGYHNRSVGTITMHELVSHTSGLPELPSNLHGTPANNFTDYSQQDLFDFLAKLTSLPTRGRFLYSNLGFGLLGYLMELRMGISFESLCRQLLFAPVGMTDTAVKLSRKAWRNQVAPGMNNGVLSERNTSYGVLQGQGALHSSIHDMALFVAACVRVVSGRNTTGMPSTLIDALQEAVVPIAADDFNAQHGLIASGWEVYTAGAQRVFWKSGGSAGYGSFSAFNPSTGRAAVALASCGNCGSKAVDQLVRNLLDQPARRLKSAAPSMVPDAYTGCFLLPHMIAKNRQPERNSSVITVQTNGSVPQLVLAGGGSADLIAFNWSSPGAMPLAFALGGNDTLCLRESGEGPLEKTNRKVGRREVYFMRDASTRNNAQTMVLHIDGWDLFAHRTSCS